MRQRAAKPERIPAVNVESGSTVRRWSPEDDTELSVDRRRFTQMMLASLGAAGFAGSLAGCVEEPAEEIVPYVNAPEHVVPGMPRYYSSVFTRNGYGYGVVVESHQGRPTKIEGNPAHPATGGASDVYMQAELLNLYDPERSRAPMENSQISSLGELELQLAKKRQAWDTNRGRGLHILTPPLTSPSLAAQLQRLLARYPEARWHQWQPISDDNALAGARLAFGGTFSGAINYRLENADVVLQLDGDLLSELPGSLAYARGFARRRNPLAAMSRVYAVQSRPTLIGAMADRRLPRRTDQVEPLAWLLVEYLDNADKLDSVDALELTPNFTPNTHQWLRRCAGDLVAHRGNSLVVAGRDQPPVVHALAHWLNHRLGNVGNTVIYRQPVVQRPALLKESLRELVDAMAAGDVENLLLLDCNPVFDAPADWEFARHLQQVPFRLHLGHYVDETAALCHWHLAMSHALESWGDARAFDGTIAIQQPLIRPLFDTVSPYGLLSFLNGDHWRSGYDCVRGYWAGELPDDDVALAWRRMLIEGVREGSAMPIVSPAPRPGLLERLRDAHTPPGDGLVLQFAPDPRLWDGRYANNAWLQELPDPFSTITWDNALMLSPALAALHDLHNGDVVKVMMAASTDNDGESVALPVWITPEHPDDAVTVYLGYGRNYSGNAAAGREEAVLSHGIGINVYPLRHSNNLALRHDITLRKTGQSKRLAITQHHPDMEGREPVRHETLHHFRQQPDFIARAHNAHPPDKSLYPEPTPEPFRDAGRYSWGMSIDLNACIGCGTCTLACQAENNIPVVGRDQVLAGREMHWLRIDRYYQPAPEGELLTLFQPMLCQHCENAPCEYVCPVGATVHDSEGLNVMVYNRCIGTRDCSQNCPYKVRRFNFVEYNYHSPRTDALAPARNPDVTVRSRGVMEKCTYCLQRISGARRQAKQEGRPIRDGEVVTACQQACPTQAITFGNISDSDTAISAAYRHPLSYSVLAELNTRPRTRYLARIRNTGTSQKDSEEKPGAGHEGTG